MTGWVVVQLSRLLNDDWTLISDYRGPGGEVDQIAVGVSVPCEVAG